MKSVEKSAKTYEEALNAALAELNASISDVDVLTLEEGSKGLFGFFGSRPTKIRVTLREEKVQDDLDLDTLLGKKKPEPVAPKAEKPAAPIAEKPAAPRAEKPAAPAVEKAAAPRAEKPAAPVAEKPAAPRAGNSAAPVAEKPAETVPGAADPAAAEPAEKKQRPPRQRKPRGEKPQQPKEPKPEKPAEEKKPLPPKEPAKPLEKPVITMLEPDAIAPDSAAGKAKAFLAELTQLMGVQVEIAVGTDPEGNIFVQMTGDTLGVLIGRRGETLDALQYLTSLKVNRGQEGYTRVTLDTENYRAKREDTLIRLANRMANRAIKTGRKVSLEPMNPYERRIIHSALQANEAVDTHSEDEEPNRHVVITLRK